MADLQTLILGSIGLLASIAAAVGSGIIAACLLIEFLPAAIRRRRARREPEAQLPKSSQSEEFRPHRRAA